MNTKDQKKNVMYLSIGLVAIVFLAGWTASFSHTCQSDGCIGIIFPAGVAFIAIIVQLLILLPLFCYRQFKAKVPFGLQALMWAGCSLAAFVIPMLFTKW